MSLELQRAFGLRREEAIKLAPSYADKGDYLLLKASWTKEGKARTISLRTTEQRDVLDRAHRLAGGGSLIPSARNYRSSFVSTSDTPPTPGFPGSTGSDISTRRIAMRS